MKWSCLGCGGQWPDTHSFCGFCGEGKATVDSGRADVDEVLRALIGDQLRDRLVEEGGRLPEERRLVSAIFADLSGFTPLAGTLDPETLASIVDPILAGLVRIVKRGEGYVGSFAGDALLAYFGAPVAHEDDAERAVRCAQEMLEEFPALLASVPPEGASLSLRIGVDTGAVMARLVAGDIKTDYNILGNSVNMAQRLQSNAPPGGCVVGATTYRLSRGAFEFEDLGGLQVKGRAEPLPAWLLTGEQRRSVQRRDSAVPLVGRQDELGALAAAEQPAAARGLLLLAEAGAGKSRLLEEAQLRSARPWFEGGCAPHDTARSYRPWSGVFEDLPGADDLPGVRLVRGLPLDPEVERLAPAARRDLVARDVSVALRTVAPAVVVLEDLHWADQPSLDLLDDVLHELGDTDVLLLATAREPIRLTAPLPHLDVKPLAASSVADLVAALLGGEPPDVLVDDIARRSGGNPLYVTELALALRERGLVELVDGGVLDATGAGLAAALDLVPDSLEGLVGARIDALPTAEERALVVASVLGAPVHDRMVSAVMVQLALPHAEVPSALAGLRAKHFLDGDQFVHAVVQNTAYVRTPRARRRTLHLAAAEAGRDLVDADDRAGFLARHLYLGGAGPRAVGALETAAAEALKRGAHEEAVLHLRREVELRADPTATEEHRAALPARLTELGEVLELLGRYLEAEAVLNDALESGAGPSAHRILIGCLRRLGRHPEAVDLADALLAADAVPIAIKARVAEERAWSLAAQGELDHALGALGQDVDALTTARHGLLRGYCWGQQGHTDEALAQLGAAAATFTQSDEPALASRALRFRGEIQATSGRLSEASVTLEVALDLARSCGAAEEAMACLDALTQATGRQADYPASTRYAREAVALSDRMRHSSGRASSRNNLAFTRYLAGDLAEAVTWSTDAVKIASAAGLPLLEGGARHTLGSALLETGDLVGAAEQARLTITLLAGTEDEVDGHDLLDAVSRKQSPSPSD